MTVYHTNDDLARRQNVLLSVGIVTLALSLGALIASMVAVHHSYYAMTGVLGPPPPPFGPDKPWMMEAYNEVELAGGEQVYKVRRGENEESILVIKDGTAWKHAISGDFVMEDGWYDKLDAAYAKIEQQETLRTLKSYIEDLRHQQVREISTD